jgi:hypothetical protein
MTGNQWVVEAMEYDGPRGHMTTGGAATQTLASGSFMKKSGIAPRESARFWDYVFGGITSVTTQKPSRKAEVKL